MADNHGQEWTNTDEHGRGKRPKPEASATLGRGMPRPYKKRTPEAYATLRVESLREGNVLAGWKTRPPLKSRDRGRLRYPEDTGVIYYAPTQTGGHIGPPLQRVTGEGARAMSEEKRRTPEAYATLKDFALPRWFSGDKSCYIR
jgi:hypothetical protein